MRPSLVLRPAAFAQALSLSSSTHPFSSSLNRPRPLRSMSTAPRSKNSYEVHYWPFHGWADVTRMMLEASGSEYKNVFISHEGWQKELLSAPRTGKPPKLVIHHHDQSTSRSINDQTSVDLYLAHILDYLPYPSSPSQEDERALARSISLSYYTSWLTLADTFGDVVKLGTKDERKKKVEKLLEEGGGVLSVVESHERVLAKAVEEERGPFYAGDKVTLPDFMSLSVSLRLDEMLGGPSNNPYNDATSFPNLVKLRHAMLAIPAVKEYVEKRRDFGVMSFDSENFEVVISKPSPKE